MRSTFEERVFQKKSVLGNYDVFGVFWGVILGVFVEDLVNE